MAPVVSGDLRDSSSPLKKGPWMESEDMILIEYVNRHGERNWNAIHRNSNLMRSGKSCRLRWANHLRPDLKKGAFSPEEEKLIVELHAQYGNKWSLMAARIPGRTDNEIKNYWNTRLKRCQRAGLPVYPQDLSQQEKQLLNSSPPSFSTLVASSQPPNPNPNPLNFYASNPSFSSPVLSEVPFFNPFPMPSVFQSNSENYGINPGPDMGVLGLPSIQSSASWSDFVFTTRSNDGAENYEVGRRHNNSGFLEDLIGESKAMKCHGKREDSFIAATRNNSKSMAPGEDISSLNEILNLLDNFPLKVPIPDWHEGNDIELLILTNGTNNAIESQVDVSQYELIADLNGATNQDYNFGSLLWNHMYA